MSDADASAAARELSRHRWRGTKLDRLVEELLARRAEWSEETTGRLTEALAPQEGEDR